MRLASQTPIASNGSRLTASSPYALSSSPPSSPSWPSSPYCPPSRGSWRYRNSAVANRVHCAPITTAQRKKQRIRLTNGGQRASVASNGRRVDSLIRACAMCARAFIASRDRSFRRIKENAAAQAFLSCARKRGATVRPVSASQMRHAMTRRIGPRSAARSCEKIFHRRGRRTVRGRKIAAEGANQCK
jgi:hypothetical protein